MLLSETGYFDAGADTKPLLHLWSLGVEEQFYLVWPVFLMLMARLNRPVLTLMLIAVLAVLSFAAHLSSFATPRSAGFYLPYTRFWELMIGAAARGNAGGRGAFSRFTRVP